MQQELRLPEANPNRGLTPHKDLRWSLDTLHENQWWRGKVVERSQDGKVLVHFDGWNKKHDTWYALEGSPLLVPPLTHTATANGVEAAPVSVSPLPCPATVINPALVPGLAHVQYAAQRALLHDAAGTRSTHSLHTELLYSLSGSRNISDALRRFGLDPAGKAVLLAAFNPSPAAWEELLLDVSGTVSGGRVWG